MKNNLDHENYQYLIKYYQDYGNINVPLGFKITTPDHKIINLGYFINSQRALYRKGLLSPAEIKYLESLNISWYPQDDEWQFMYNLVKEYKEEHGDINIHPKYVKIIDDKPIFLGRWLDTQRRNYKNACRLREGKWSKWCLSQNRITLLENLGIDWHNTSEQNWLLKYQEVLKCIDHFGSLNIPNNCKATLDNGKEFSINEWLSQNKKKYCLEKDKLTTEQIDLLKKINITSYGTYNYAWDFMYNEAKKYYETYGNLKVPATYSYLDDKDNLIKLGIWINSQRKRYKNNINPQNHSTCQQKLDKRQIKLLNEIKMVWKIRTCFEDAYPYLMAYYNFYGNLNIPKDFKTSDGYTYEENGKINLYQWLYNFKNSINPLSSNALKLSQMGMTWPVKINQKTVFAIALENAIDLDLNRAILERISYIELISKITYLRENNLAITTNGYLNPIFSMASPDIKNNYHISLEEIIANFYAKKLKK